MKGSEDVQMARGHKSEAVGVEAWPVGSQVEVNFLMGNGRAIA